MCVKFPYTVKGCSEAIKWLKEHPCFHKPKGREESGYEIVHYANIMYKLEEYSKLDLFF